MPHTAKIDTVKNMKPTYKQLVALIYTVVIFLDRLDLTIVNVTFPTMAKYFGVSLIITQWLSLAFLLALAVSIPISTWLAERFGFKKIYIVAMLLFGFGSTLCAFTNSLNQLVFLRFVQGIGGGLLIPVGMTMIYRVYDKSEYASVTSFTFLPSLIAPAIAPFLGGVLLEFLGWRWVFVCSGPICLLLAFASMMLLEEEQYQSKEPLDWLGFILSSAMLIMVFYGLSQLSVVGFAWNALLPLILVIPLIWLFIKTECHQKHPLFDLSFFQHKIFARANFIQLCFQICHFGAIFLVGLFLQAGVGFSAIFAGLMMGMQAVGAMMTSRYSVHLFNQYGAKRPIIIGLSGIVILSPMIMLINKPNMLIFGLILFLLRGLFSGLCGTPIQTLSVIGFEKKEMGTVNSIFNACRQISISFGIAMSSLLIAIGLHMAGLSGTFIPHSQLFVVFSYGFWMLPIVGMLGIFITCGLTLK